VVAANKKWAMPGALYYFVIIMERTGWRRVNERYFISDSEKNSLGVGWVPLCSYHATCYCLDISSLDNGYPAECQSNIAFCIIDDSDLKPRSFRIQNRSRAGDFLYFWEAVNTFPEKERRKPLGEILKIIESFAISPQDSKYIN